MFLISSQFIALLNSFKHSCMCVCVCVYRHMHAYIQIEYILQSHLGNLEAYMSYNKVNVYMLFLRP